ncbi:MAG: T9SS type A sorting domain-containing protein [Balneolaceae bacterium]
MNIKNYIFSIIILLFLTNSSYGQLRWPISNSIADNADVITSAYGPRTLPSGNYDIHYGIDLNKPNGGGGDNIYAPSALTVVNTGWNSVAGNFLTVEFDDPDGNVTSILKFLHLDEDPQQTNANIYNGAIFGIGQLIGIVGATGSATYSHLHLAYYPDNAFYSDPEYETENPIQVLNNDFSDNYTINNVSLERFDSNAWLTFSVFVPSKRLNLNRVEVSFKTFGNDGQQEYHSDGSSPPIESQSNYVCLNNECFGNQLIGVVDFQERIGITPDDQSELYNGVKIEPSELNNYSGSGYQSHDHQYKFSFKLDEDILKNTVGGLIDTKIKAISTRENASPPVTFNLSAGDSNIRWLQELPYNTVINNNVNSINLDEGGRVLILNQNSTKQQHITFYSTPVNINNGGKFELQAGSSASSRTYFDTQSTFNVNDGGELILGAHTWFTNEGGDFNASSNATITTGTGAEFFGIGNGSYKFNNLFTLNSSESCIAVGSGASVIFENGASFSGGSFLAGMSSGDGTIEVRGTLTLNGPGNNDGYSMDLRPGTSVKMNYNSKITVEEGAKMRTEGTSSNPVLFTYNGIYDPDEVEEWAGIELRGDGNIFKYTIIEEAHKPLTIRSKNNIIEQSIIRNNSTYGIRTGYVYGSPGTWSSLLITDSHIHHNEDGGVYLRSAHAGIQYTDINNNYGDGIYLYNATLGNNGTTGSGYFRKNYINDNSGNGIRIAYNSTVYDGKGSTKGNNAISENGDHAIYLSSTSARWYDAISGSYSNISSPYGNMYLYNLAQTTSGETTVSWEVGAINNAWSFSEWPNTNPVSSQFHGSVDYDPWQVGYIAGNVGPRYSLPSNNIQTLNEYVPQLVLSANVVQTTTADLENDAQRDTYLEFSDHIKKLKKEIEDHPRDKYNPRRLNGIFGYYNQLPESKKEEFLEVKVLASSMINPQHLAGLEVSGNHTDRMISETALLLSIQQKQLDGDAEGALSDIQRFENTFTNLDMQRELELVKLAALEDLERYQEALLVLDNLTTLSKLGIDPEGSANNYQTLKNTYAELLVEQQGDGDIQVQKVKRSKEKEAEELPEAFGLHDAYPNPFNPSTVLKFEVPNTGKVRVEVFDIAGRLVSVLANQNYQAGVHQLRFDAEGLASGVYLVRAQYGGVSETKKITLVK